MMRLHIGRIVGAHGIQGELRVFPLVNEESFYQKIDSLNIEGYKDGVKIIAFKKNKGVYLLKIDEITTRTEAERLTGKTLTLDEADMPKLDEGHYIYELIGLRALDRVGREIGVLSDILLGAVNDVYVITTDKGEILVPNVPNFIRERNVEEGFIRVELIEGMEP